MGTGVAAEASGARSEAGGGVGGAPCGASACCCRFLLSSASHGGTAADTSLSTAGSSTATPELVAAGWLAADAAAGGSARSRAARIQGGSSLAAAAEGVPWLGRLLLSAAAADGGRTWSGAGSAAGAPFSLSERSRAARRRSFSSSIAGKEPKLRWRQHPTARSTGGHVSQTNVRYLPPSAIYPILFTLAHLITEL